MNLLHLKYAVIVAETNSMTKAAGDAVYRTAQFKPRHKGA